MSNTEDAAKRLREAVQYPDDHYAKLDDLRAILDERDALKARLDAAESRYESLRLSVVNPPHLLFQEHRSYVYQPYLGIERTDQAMRAWEDWWRELSTPLVTKEEFERFGGRDDSQG